MGSREFALLRGGEIWNVLYSTASLRELREKFPEHEVLPMENVPLAVKENYEYWTERP